jgi:glycosyltransferase involved in cell wall biosynthesis
MCCNGRLSAEYSQTLGINADRITTGNMVADTEGIRKRTSTVSMADREALRRRIGATGLTFLVVSRLIRPKGIRELMEGWTAFSAEANEPVCLVIVGGGPEELFLRDFIGRRNLKDVCLVGPVTYSDVHRFYAASDVLVMPTLEDNWSLVVPEAMACGLPVLCSIYNGCYPEMITEGKTGWVFDPLKKRETVWALRRFLRAKQDQTLSEMGKTAQALVDSFSPRSAAAAILRACDLAFTKSSGKRHRGDGLRSLGSTAIKR